MKRVIIGVTALGIIAVIGVFVLYSSLGTLITKAITTVGPEIILARVELKETVINTTSGKGSMHELFIGNPEGFETESAFKMNEVRLELARKRRETRLGRRAVTIGLPARERLRGAPRHGCGPHDPGRE